MDLESEKPKGKGIGSLLSRAGFESVKADDSAPKSHVFTEWDVKIRRSEEPVENAVNTPSFASSSGADATRPIEDFDSPTPHLNSRRAKSALRLRYEAEVGVIRKKLGDLEAIRASLGLTQRKMCQLLFVDPSAWTRWTKGGEEAPPHVYRMLQWYLALEEKYPAMDASFWLAQVARVPEPDSGAQLKRLKELEKQIADLNQQLLASRKEARITELKLKSTMASAVQSLSDSHRDARTYLVAGGSALLAFVLAFVLAKIF